MKPSEPSPGGVAGALARWARAEPEAPFLFYRNTQGHFRWWSFSTAAAFLGHGGDPIETLSAMGVVVEREAMELLGGFLRAAIGDGFEPFRAEEVPAAEPTTERDVWISWQPLTEPAALALARWAMVTGAAIHVEPGSSLHPELFAWARPTIASGSVDDLVALADGVAALAPRFLRRRWLRQRGERLRLLILGGHPAENDLVRVRERWQVFAPAQAIDVRRVLV